jgi:hypothetical protein
MAYLIAVAAFSRVALIDRRIRIGSASLQLIALAGLIIVEWWICGYISLETTVNDLYGGGLGGLTLNLLGPLDPKGFSLFLPDLPAAQGMRGRVDWSGQSGAEAQSYLGLGVIILLLVVIGALPWSHCRLLDQRKHLAIVVMAVSATIFASYGSVTIGSKILFEYSLPWQIEKLLGTFRSTIRFFWIPYYLLIGLALAFLCRNFKAKVASALACGVLLIQVVGAARSGVSYDNTGDEPLVILRYFGPGVNPHAPNIGDAKKK